MNKQYHNNDDDDDEKLIPTWFYLPYCDECKKYTEFVKKIIVLTIDHIDF